MKDLSERWKNMSEEERTAAVGDGVEELEERRENRKEGVQNVLINSFHDTRATLGIVQREVCRLLFLMHVISSHSHVPSSRLSQVALGCASSPLPSAPRWTPTTLLSSSSATLACPRTSRQSPRKPFTSSRWGWRALSFPAFRVSVGLLPALRCLLISTIAALTRNHRNQLHDWKNKTANLILEKLRKFQAITCDALRHY